MKDNLHQYEIIVLNQLLDVPMNEKELVEKTGLSLDKVRRTIEWLKLKNKINVNNKLVSKNEV